MGSVLLTGFRSFDGEEINPSELLLSEVTDDSLAGKLLLPVSYLQSVQKIREELQSGRYDQVLMMGQAGGRSKVCMERFAVNCADAVIADCDGTLLKDCPIEPAGVTAYQTIWPLRKWLDDSLQNAGAASSLPLEISNSAGTYVCNYLSYRVSQEFPKVKSLFVHVPYLPEQIKNKPMGTPSLTLGEMKTCVEFILQSMKR